MAESIERLSFELTSGALTEQERAVSSLRSSAGIVLSAASIAGSFLGSRMRSGSLDAWSILATIFFVLCFASAILVLLPRSLVLAFDGRELLIDGELEERDDGVREGYRAVCEWARPALRNNTKKIEQLSRWLKISCLLLAFEVVFWTIGATS